MFAQHVSKIRIIFGVYVNFLRDEGGVFQFFIIFMMINVMANVQATSTCYFTIKNSINTRGKI